MLGPAQWDAGYSSACKHLYPIQMLVGSGSFLVAWKSSEWWYNSLGFSTYMRHIEEALGHWLPRLVCCQQF